jgi:hypothetical protein
LPGIEKVALAPMHLVDRSVGEGKSTLANLLEQYLHFLSHQLSKSGSFSLAAADSFATRREPDATIHDPLFSFYNQKINF